MTIAATIEKDPLQCDALCPQHGVQCRLKMVQQEAYPMHAHLVDGKMCLWKK